MLFIRNPASILYISTHRFPTCTPRSQYVDTYTEQTKEATQNYLPPTVECRYKKGLPYTWTAGEVWLNIVRR